MNVKSIFDKYGDVLLTTVLAILVLAIYGQAIRFEFINLDDNGYVYENTAVRAGLSWEAVQWAFYAFHSANWHPLTWLSHMLDVKMFGLNAGGHHAVNVVFHLLNAALVFAVFRKMTGCLWRSFIVAALFAVHPAHVESVAWIAERKDVLSTFFWFLTMYAYLRWNEEGANLRSPFYFATILLFMLGLMSKPMLVTLPFVLLLCDLWPLERLKLFDWKCIGQLVAEKIPLFALSAASSYVTVLAQRSSGAFESLEYLPLGERWVNAILSYAKYVAMLFYPANLAVWYPYDRNVPTSYVFAAAVLLIIITSLCVWQVQTRKYLLMGWLWFLGTLVPVIGIVQVGSQSMADRYTYVPYFGIFIMLVWGVGDLFKKFELDQKIALALFGVAIIIFAVVSYDQTSRWRDNETLYKHALAVTGDNYLISHNLCYALTFKDSFDEAEGYCRTALRLRPGYANGYNTLGILELKRGRFAESEQNFSEVLRLDPSNTLVYNNLAVAQALQGKPDEAEATLEKGVRLSGNSVRPELWINTLNDIAIAFVMKNNYEKAAQNLARILAIDPNNLAARNDLAMALFKMNRYDEAEKVAATVIELNPNDAMAHNIYGLILLEKKRNAEAIEKFEKAVELLPDFVEAKENLKKARGEK